MKFLIDTNVLLRLFQPNHPHTALAEAAINALINSGYSPCLVPQNLYEFWAVATRPSVTNGLGMSAIDAKVAVDELVTQFIVLRDERGIFDIWINLVAQHQVSGKITHDARLAAAMEKHGIPSLLTFNDSDFRRFTNLRILHPEHFTSSAPQV